MLFDINNNIFEKNPSFFTKMEELAKKPKRYLALDREKDFYKEIGFLKKLGLTILSFFNSKNPSSPSVLRFHLIKNLLKEMDHLSKNQVNEIKVVAKKIGIIGGTNDSLNQLIDDCYENKDRESLDKKIETYFKKHTKQLSHFFDLKASLLPTKKVEKVVYTPEPLSLEIQTLVPSTETKKNSSSEVVVTDNSKKTSNPEQVVNIGVEKTSAIIDKELIEELPLPVDPSAVASKNSNIKKMILGGVALTIVTIGLGILATNYYPWSKPSDEQKNNKVPDEQGSDSENGKVYLGPLNKDEAKKLNDEFSIFINKVNGENTGVFANKTGPLSEKTFSFYTKINGIASSVANSIRPYSDMKMPKFLDDAISFGSNSIEAISNSWNEDQGNFLFSSGQMKMINVLKRVTSFGSSSAEAISNLGTNGVQAISNSWKEFNSATQEGAAKIGNKLYKLKNMVKSTGKKPLSMNRKCPVMQDSIAETTREYFNSQALENMSSSEVPIRAIDFPVLFVKAILESMGLIRPQPL